MDKLTNEIENKIKLLEKEKQYARERYNNKIRDNIFPKEYEIDELIDTYKTQLVLLKELDKEGIDIDEKYYLCDDIYLAFMATETGISPYFFIEGERSDFMYENFIRSWAGLNEWITQVICGEYDLLIGSSKYNYALGCYSLRDRLDDIERKETIVVDKVRLIERLINFVEDDGILKKAIVDVINYKFKIMAETLG